MNWSALHAPAAAPLHQAFHLGHAHAVEVAADGVLEAAGRHGEFQRRLFILIGVEAINQAAAEAVAAAHAVHDVGDAVLAAEEEVLAVVEAGAPVVVVGALGFTQGDGHAPAQRKIKNRLEGVSAGVATVM